MKSLNVKELTELLIKHFDIKEGQYDLVVEFGIGVGKVGPDDQTSLPGVMVGVSKVGLALATNAGPNVVDAKSVQPKKKPVARKRVANK